MAEDSYDKNSFAVSVPPPGTSSISWLHDELLRRLTDRREALKERMAQGVPLAEYAQFVGRCVELRRLIQIDIPELFTDFYQSDAEEGEDDGL